MSAGSNGNYKPLTKQERWALREVMTNSEIGVWRGLLDGPQKRRLNHPNAVINKWKSGTQTREPKERKPSPALSPALAERDKTIAQLQAHVVELEAARETAASPGRAPVTDGTILDRIAALVDRRASILRRRQGTQRRSKRR